MTLHDLPDAPPGYFTWRYQVGLDGRISALFGTFPTSKTHPPGNARNSIAVLEHGSWREVAGFPYNSMGCAWDVATDDWCIVAAVRSRGDPNGSALSEQKLERTFPLGDAIEHIQCDATGFWVGYFDEASDHQGLVHFDRRGEREFGYPGHILDCYALNVTRDDAWACPYTDFPIVSLSSSGVHREWENLSITGATALAVHDRSVALVGGYEGNRNRIALLELNDRHARVVAKSNLSDVFPGLSLDAQILARGNRIYAMETDRYRVCTVPELGMGRV